MVTEFCLDIRGVWHDRHELRDYRERKEEIDEWWRNRHQLVQLREYDNE